MSGIDRNLDSESPLFVLATRLYVHYKLKARKTFNPQAALIDDDYAREVLTRVRAMGDLSLLEMAERFEAARFPAGAAAHPVPAPVNAASPSKDEPLLDFPLESAS